MNKITFSDPNIVLDRATSLTCSELFEEATGALAIGDLETAVSIYQRCVEADPNFFEGWHALGMALMKLDRYPEAIQAGLRATELSPNDQLAW